MPDSLNVPDLDAEAFSAAVEAGRGLNPFELRKALDAYLNSLHVSVRRVHEDTPLTAEETLDAFRPRDVEF